MQQETASSIFNFLFLLLSLNLFVSLSLFSLLFCAHRWSIIFFFFSFLFFVPWFSFGSLFYIFVIHFFIFSFCWVKRIRDHTVIMRSILLCFKPWNRLTFDLVLSDSFIFHFSREFFYILCFCSVFVFFFFDFD